MTFARHAPPRARARANPGRAARLCARPPPGAPAHPVAVIAPRDHLSDGIAWLLLPQPRARGAFPPRAQRARRAPNHPAASLEGARGANPPPTFFFFFFFSSARSPPRAAPGPRAARPLGFRRRAGRRWYHAARTRARALFFIAPLGRARGGRGAKRARRAPRSKRPSGPRNRARPHSGTATNAPLFFLPRRARSPPPAASPVLALEDCFDTHLSRQGQGRARTGGARVAADAWTYFADSPAGRGVRCGSARRPAGARGCAPGPAGPRGGGRRSNFAAEIGRVRARRRPGPARARGVRAPFRAAARPHCTAPRGEDEGGG